MPLNFKSLTRPRRAAKALCELLPGTKLAEAQTLVARMCGFESWAELKRASEEPSSQADPDDEDLTPEALRARHDLQARQLQAALDNTLAQARELVRLTTPSARTPQPIPPDVKASTSKKMQFVGTSVYWPHPGTYFAPHFAEVFYFLHDVDWLRLEFVQPDEHNGILPHLAARVHLRFRGGRTLALDGTYFWKFLDLVPEAFGDGEGGWSPTNPFNAHESCEDMMQRLRLGYGCLFSHEEDYALQLKHEPLAWVELDLVKGELTTRRPPGLAKPHASTLYQQFEIELETELASLRPLLDDFVLRTLRGPYSELKAVAHGGRMSAPVVRNQYVSGTWTGTGHWTLEDLLRSMSHVPLNPQGHGGNFNHGDLLEQELTPVARDLATRAFAALASDEPVYTALAEQLEAPGRTRNAAIAVTPQSMTDALWQTRDRLSLVFKVRHKLAHSVFTRRLDSWLPTLGSDPARISPGVRIQAVLDEMESNRKGAAPPNAAP